MTYQKAMSLILRKIEALIERTEEEMDIWERRLGYVPIEVQNKNYETIKGVIKMIDKNEIAEKFFLEYNCEFPFMYGEKVINSYDDIAEILTKWILLKAESNKRILGKWEGINALFLLSYWRWKEINSNGFVYSDLRREIDSTIEPVYFSNILWGVNMSAPIDAEV